MKVINTAFESGMGTRKRERDQTPLEQYNTSLDMFGGADSQRISQMGDIFEKAGNSIQEIESRVKGRKDIANKYAAQNEFNLFHTKILPDFENGDMFDPSHLNKFHQQLNLKEQEILKKFEKDGTVNGYSNLVNILNTLKTNYINQSVTRVNNAQKTVVKEGMEKQANLAVLALQENPSTLKEYSQSIVEIVEENELALTPEEQMDFVENGYRNGIMAVVNSYLILGEFEEARNFIKENESMMSLFTGEQINNLFNTINNGILQTQEQNIQNNQSFKDSNDYQPLTQEGKLWQDYNNAIRRGNLEEIKFFKNIIDAQNQKSTQAQKKQYKADKAAIERFERNSNTIYRNINDAFSIIFKGEPVDDDTDILELMKRRGFDKTATGGLSLILGSDHLPFSTDAIKLKSVLKPIQSLVTTGKMAELKESSPTGSTGFGALSEKELELLRGSSGSFDLRTPEVLVKTLLTIRKNLKDINISKRQLFNEKYNKIATNEEESLPSQPQQNQNEQVEVNIKMLNGDSIKGLSNTQIINIITDDYDKLSPEQIELLDKEIDKRG